MITHFKSGFLDFPPDFETEELIRTEQLSN